MTLNQFRELALSLPEAVEASHLRHPDFRVGGKIFATLGYPDDEWGMVKLTPAQQAEWLRMHPEAFRPAAGAWGARGSTLVRLAAATEEALRPALLDAWRNVAPKHLAASAGGPAFGPDHGDAA